MTDVEFKSVVTYDRVTRLILAILALVFTVFGPVIWSGQQAREERFIATQEKLAEAVTELKIQLAENNKTLEAQTSRFEALETWVKSNSIRIRDLEKFRR